MAVSPWLASNHAGPVVDLNQLVNGGSPNGVLYITHNGAGDYADARLAIAASTSVAGDYMAGSVALAGVQDTVQSLGGGGLIVGIDASPYTTALTVSGGEVGSLLAITQKTPTGELAWVGGSPSDGQFLGYTTADGIAWQAPAYTNMPTISVAGTSQLMAANTRYVTANPSLTTLTLPTTASLGDVFKVYGLGGLWTITAGSAGQTIRMLDQVSGPDVASITSTIQGHAIELVCVDDASSGNEIFGLVSGTGANIDY